MHDHSHGINSASKLRIALVVTLVILAIEVAGGIVARSLALFADAAHMLTDVAAAGFALWAVGFAQRAADHKRTFGYGRATVLAALANSTALVVIVIGIVVEALHRFAHPQSVNAGIMLLAGVVSIVLNGALAWYLSRGEASLNVRAVIAHVAGDALISGGVIVAAVLIALTGVRAIDPTVSILATLLILRSTWSVLKESVNVLLEGVPRGMDLGAMRDAVRAGVAIEDLHDLHVWSVADGSIAASLHLRVDSTHLATAPDIVGRVKNLLHDRFNVTHATIEIECVDCEASC